MNYDIVESPFGTLMLLSDGQALKRLEFIDADQFQPKDSWNKKSDPVLQRARKQLAEWCSGTRQSFDLPLAPDGTDFQKQAWQQLSQIPFGQTRSYSQQAEALGNPRAARAVGAANGKNPIPLIIPCHRVVGRNGSLTGYAYGLAIKKLLLEFEEKALLATSTSIQ